jgi:hypothetical protein
LFANAIQENIEGFGILVMLIGPFGCPDAVAGLLAAIGVSACHCSPMYVALVGPQVAMG